MKIFLIKEQYLQYLSQEELACLFQDFNFDIIQDNDEEQILYVLIHLALLDKKIINQFVKKEFFNFIDREEYFPLRQITYTMVLNHVSNEIFDEFTVLLSNLIRNDPLYFKSKKIILNDLYTYLKDSELYSRANEIKYLLLFLGPANWDDWYNLAMDWYSLRDKSRVIQSFNQVIRIYKNSFFGILHMDAICIERMADILVEYKEFDKAIDVYIALKNEYPDNFTYLKKLGETEFKNEEYHEAEWSLLRAYKRKKDDIQVLKLLGYSFFYRDEFKKAILH